MSTPFEADRAGRIVKFPKLAVLPGRDGEHAWFETRSPFEFVDHKRRVWVDAGLVFDGATVPEALFPLLRCNFLDLIIPALPHDAGYRTDQVMLDRRTGRPYEFDDEDDERKHWDKVLSKCCGAQNIRWIDRKLIYAGVRAGGGSSFHRKTLAWRPGDPE